MNLPMHKKILALAIPSIISNISIPLVSSVDTMLMGHLSVAHLAALGVMSMVFLFLYGTFNFLRMGTTGMTAQAYGKEDNHAIAYTLYRALFLAFVSGILLILFQKPIEGVALYLMNTGESFYDLGSNYFSIRIYTAPAVFMLYVMMGWFFGMQNAIYPLVVTLLLNVTNIVCSYYFVYHLHWGIEGAAYGTLVSQYVALLLSFVLLLKYKSSLVDFSLSKLLVRRELLRFFTVNRDIFVRTLALTFAFAFFYSQASKESEETLGVMILLLQFIVWFAYSLDGFANAAESLVGRYYGANEWREFSLAVRYSLYWSVGLAFVYMFFYLMAGESILTLYTNQQQLITNTMQFMPYIVMMPLLSFLAYIWDGIYIGMTATKSMMYSILLPLGAFIVLFYATKSINFTYSLWLSFLAFFMFRGLMQSVLFWKYGRGLM